MYVNNEHPTNMASKGSQFRHKWIQHVYPVNMTIKGSQ